MTEADWLTEPDFAAQVWFAVEHLRLSPRRQRLLAAGFCRAALPLFDHPEFQQVLEVIEQSADGCAAPGALESGRQRCREIALESYEEYVVAVDEEPDARPRHSAAGQQARSEFAWALAYSANSPPPVAEVGTKAAGAAAQARTGVARTLPPAPTEYTAALADQMLAMRPIVWEVVGNPFRPVHFSAAWRTDTALALARQMYESREFSAMPILADALQDAGCDSEDILSHCRDRQLTHLRGCWVVDLLLGKE